MNLLRKVFNFHYLPSMKFGFMNYQRAYFSESSRQIQFRMRQERNKNLNNKFKALHSHFGLKRPNQVSSNYSKPSVYEYSLDSLRKNSHMHPEYLLSQLNNNKSQYYEVIEKLFESLGSAGNKESIQFLQFMVLWKIYRHNIEYTQVLVRKISQMKMNINEIFRILKVVVYIEQQQIKSLIMVNLQNKLLQKIVDIEYYQYQSLFKLLNFMRFHDLSPKVSNDLYDKVIKGQSDSSSRQDSFFKVVETVILRNIDEIPLANLTEMIVHYGNNIKQDYDDKLQILSKLQPKILQNLPFFTHDQLVAIMFSYLKTQSYTDELIKAFLKRIQLLYFQISWENKRKILSIAPSLPFDSFLSVVGLSIHQILKGKKVIYKQGRVETDPNARQVQYQLLPAIYLASYQTNLITLELVQKIQPKILENIFNYPSEDVGLIAWLFTITPPSLTKNRQNRQILYVKLEGIIIGGFNKSTFTLKDISMVVWSLCNYRGSTSLIYKQNADFWKNIEYYIQQRIGNKRQQKILNGCCQVLWAYLNNKPLTIKTISIITDIIIQKQNEGLLVNQIFNFQLLTITSFYYSLKQTLPSSIINYIEKLSLKYFKLLLQEMDYLQIMKILKFIINDKNGQLDTSKLDNDIWGKIINQFYIDIQKVQYSYIMGVIGYTIISPQGKAADPKVVQIVTKLMARKKRLQQLDPTIRKA